MVKSTVTSSILSILVKLEWKFEEELIARIIAAPSLEEAIMEADIVLKSVGDATALRREAKKRKANPPIYTMDKFNRPAEDLSKPILVWGDSDCGKTQLLNGPTSKTTLLSGNTK